MLHIKIPNIMINQSYAAAKLFQPESNSIQTHGHFNSIN